MAGRTPWAWVKKKMTKPSSVYADYVIVYEGLNSADVEITVLGQEKVVHTIYNVPHTMEEKHKYIQKFTLEILRQAVNSSDPASARRNSPVHGKVWIDNVY